MFSKKLFIFCFVFGLSSVSYANIFSELTCVQDMNRYYPYLIQGKLKWPEQKRFFRCLHDALELFVEKDIFTHDPSRDYFTKGEIFKMFHWYFEYGEDRSRQLTNQIFALKKILIGGSIDQLKDQEIETFYKLIYDYQDIYFTLHEQIPVIRQVFSSSEGITPEQNEEALNKIRNSFVLLERAYDRENIVYPIDDLHRYGEYLQELQHMESVDIATVQKSMWFLQNLFEGIFFPKKNIQEKEWKAAFYSLYKTIELFFYYKTYFMGRDLSPTDLTYRMLDSAEILISSLQVEGMQRDENNKGFPLNNLDGMLSVLFSFWDQNSSDFFRDGIFKNIHQNQLVPLLTRALNCFFIDSSAEKNCKSTWGSGGTSSPMVVLSFSDAQFDFFPNRVETHLYPGSLDFMDQRKLQHLKQWISNYKDSMWEIHYGNVRTVAAHRQFDHWLSSFFGWEAKGRIEFGSFHPPSDKSKFYQLLNYHAFLPLLLSSYMPEGFFFSQDEEKPASMPFETWKSIVEDISPVLAVLVGNPGYKSSWRPALFDLFNFADSFLYSSNRDGFVDSMELMDLTVHFLEGMKSVKMANKKLSTWCTGHLNAGCVTKKLLEDQELLAAYPRFQNYLFDLQMDQYVEKVSAILGGPEEPVQALDLFPVFLLIQTMELNYELIDSNRSFNLESNELALFAQKFEEQLAFQIPYISNREQAQSYLMYSFKTGNIPFFTGDRWAPLAFTNWHLDSSKNRRPFKISPNEFHFIIFDFYNLYQNL